MYFWRFWFFVFPVKQGTGVTFFCDNEMMKRGSSAADDFRKAKFRARGAAQRQKKAEEKKENRKYRDPKRAKEKEAAESKE